MVMVPVCILCKLYNYVDTHIYIYTYIHVRVCTYVVCICANVYSMYMYVYMHMSMYPSPPVDVVGWRGEAEFPLCSAVKRGPKTKGKGYSRP